MIRPPALALIPLLGLALSARAEKKVVVPEGAAASAAPLSAAIDTGDLVFVSGMLGRDRSGRFAAGDAAAQTRTALDNVGAALKAAGLGFSHVASATVYVTDLRLLPAVDEVYGGAFGATPPARTVLEAMLMAPQALVEISAVAVRGPAAFRPIRPEGWLPPAGPYSHAILAGDTLFLSGLRPVDPKTGKLAGETIQAQAAQAMHNQEELLKAAGLGFADLVYSRIYLSEPPDYAGLNETYRTFVTAVPPARATVRGAPVEPGHLLQIQSMAVHGSGVGRPKGEGYTSPIHSFSVKAGKRIYITGMTGRAPDGRFARGDIRAQTRQALETIREQLARFGAGFGDIVDCVVWLRDARDFAAMNEVYREIVKPAPPARATVRIPPTAPEALIEIMMIAAAP